METTTLKYELYEKIEHADEQQLHELYGLVINFFNGQHAEWDSLSVDRINRINKSIEQADAGLGVPVNEAIIYIKNKYGLNG